MKFGYPTSPGIRVEKRRSRRGGFENDEHTLALWHFDEPQGSAVYIDSSGHGNTLVASNFRSVSLAGKRPVTWAHIKKMR